MSRPVAAIVGSGNIGTDLMEKLLRSEHVELRYVVGIDEKSEGLSRARRHGLDASAEGVDWLFGQSDLPAIVFEATSAGVHLKNAPRYEEAGMVAIDLTPAALGPYVIPPVNLRAHIDMPNINLVTCGGQATIPMVYAVSRTVPTEYSEIVSTVASKSAGPGTRQNIDEFTRTTGHAVEVIGGAKRGKPIIILNPAEPPLLMQCTVFSTLPPETSFELVDNSIRAMVSEVQTYVPGYRLRTEPQFDFYGDEGASRVAIFVEVEGSGDYLPPYAGNLDIMTAAAAKVGDEVAKYLERETEEP